MPKTKKIVFEIFEKKGNNRSGIRELPKKLRNPYYSSSGELIMEITENRIVGAKLTALFSGDFHQKQ